MQAMDSLGMIVAPLCKLVTILYNFIIFPQEKRFKMTLDLFAYYIIYIA